MHGDKNWSFVHVSPFIRLMNLFLKDFFILIRYFIKFLNCLPKILVWFQFCFFVLYLIYQCLIDIPKLSFAFLLWHNNIWKYFNDFLIYYIYKFVPTFTSFQSLFKNNLKHTNTISQLFRMETRKCINTQDGYLLSNFCLVW